MVIWSGLGIIVPFIVIAVFIAFQVAIDAVLGNGYTIGHVRKCTRSMGLEMVARNSTVLDQKPLYLIREYL